MLQNNKERSLTEQALRLLEFERIRQLLQARTRTEPGRILAGQLAPLGDRRQALQALAEVGEARRLLAEAGEAPLAGVADLRPLLARVQAEDAWLEAEALLRVAEAVAAAGECRSWFRQETAPGLAAHAAALEPLRGLLGALRESIGSRGEVLDSASFELAEIRGRIRELRDVIRQRLERMLHDEQLAPAFQEKLITLRGERYVLPVRADRRGLVRGFVHDESGSGQTLYVEPAAILEANNELVHLLRAEQREVLRILRRLSSAVRRATTELQRNQELLALLDLRLAAGRLSSDMDGCAPRFSEQPEIALKQARHPLLLFDAAGKPASGRAVAVDLELDARTRVLVISGPNTGGKTVALKSFGLLQLMLAAGLHIPCHPDSRTWLFGRVLADIGDEQSIAEGLSTFSAHLLRLRQILEQAGEDVLVLLDEIGTGTDPAEGSALAMALLDHLRRQEARVVATTHLHLVKAFAQLEPDMSNAAVAFDPADFRPTYRLNYGIPGASGALSIAAGLGFPPAVLERARGYLEPGEQAGKELLEELNRQLQTARAKAAEAEELLRRARQERDKRTRLLHQLEQQRQELLDRARREAKKLVRQAERRLQEIVDAAEGGLSTPQRAERAAQIRQLEEALQPAAAPSRRKRLHRPRVGDRVRHRLFGQEGEVLRVDGDEIDLLVGGKRLRCRLADLEPATAGRPPKERVRVQSRVTADRLPERLVLVGQRVDDALPKVEKFLDEALLQGCRQVEIVHGSGEGILRRAVRDLLAGHRAVTAFHAADVSRGGDNVTVVELES
ncbi:DNA mismatch repair protein MutS2 [Geothermobacter ehrlichii]|uniref:Endonuclease MutS2 n=1 Tax=Geothermobacter ehrlichii TaxID=213224 RepID=A0A5D3WLT4_9BACT|nr:endonuclease MutS2 [Geothermobacter ehrlichii]TYO98509.1 DNA mismatch repair protein MutS2 [Geothermobacter ehrlichii]